MGMKIMDTTVSYTHLDVYKRQVYYGSHNALTGIGFDNYTFTEKLFGIKGTEALDQYGSLFNTNSVSYTHLDVYKRQTIGCSYIHF